MGEPQEIVIVDGAGAEHHFPAGFDPKRAAAIVRQQSDVRSRPLLMGNSDAGAAKQFSDPSAMADLNSAKDTAANVGIATGAAALGGTGAYGAAPGVVKGIGQGLLYGGAYKAGTAAGVPPDIMAIMLAAAGLSKGGGGKSAPVEEPAPSNVGGRLSMTKAPSVEQQMSDWLSELQQPSKPNQITTPEPVSLPPGYTPRLSGRMIGAPSGGTTAPPVASPSALADMEASAPASNTAASKPFLMAKPPSDMPRSWHAFLNESAREEADPAALKQAGALHRELAQMDASYRASTAGERAQFQAMPQNYKDALLSALFRGSQ